MSVESSEALERSVLEGKDRDSLLRIAEVLGVKAGSRTKKAEIVDRILEQTGASPARSDSRRGGHEAGLRPVEQSLDLDQGGVGDNSVRT